MYQIVIQMIALVAFSFSISYTEKMGGNKAIGTELISVDITKLSPNVRV